MANVPEIKVKLTAEDTGVSAAIKELTSQLKTLKKQQDDVASSGISLKNVFAGIAAAGALIGFARIGKEAFDSAVDIGKMADKTGLTTQTLSVFHKVANDVAVSTEAVDKGLTKAAKSITEFEQGNQKAVKAFQLLGITQKDFQGLKADEKIALITERLGKMSAGFQKATATQIIFSKGGAEMIPVLNALAAEGFDKATESTRKLGLLLDQESTDAFRTAKASIQELTDLGKGMATQFEAGMLPAISDVADALLEALGEGGAGGGFRELGEISGSVIRGISAGLLSIGVSAGTAAAEVVEYFKLAWSEAETDAKTTWATIKGFFHGGLQGAINAGTKEVIAGDAATNEFKERVAAMEKYAQDQQTKIYQNLFPDQSEEERRRKARLARLRSGDQTEPPEVTPSALPTDAAAKAALALLERQLQDELAIHRAFAKQAEQIETGMYEKGELSLKAYFDHRRVAATSDSKEEIAILRRGIDAANAEAQKAATAKQKAATPKEADKQEGIRLQALTKVEELQTKIKEIEINTATKVLALNAEEFKKREENQQKILEFHKLIDVTQGNALEAAKKEIAIEQQKLRIILAESGATQAEIDKELARYAAVKIAEVTFTEEQKDGANALKLLADQKAAIEDKVQNGKLFQAQADQQILDLYRQQIPALQQIADLLKANARTDQEQVQAEDFQANLDRLKTATNTVGQQMKTLKLGLQDALTGGLTQSFALLFQGTQNIGMAFRNMASSVISSIAQMIAQMYIQIVVAKLLKSVMGGFSGGGLVPAAAAPGHAEGGLIRGPGGPKSDSIPARVSPGEYIVKADAVSAFGVQNLEAINRGLKIPSLERLALPKFAEGGLVGNAGGSGESHINLGIGLDEGLILKHLSSKSAANIILQHLTNNPKAAGKALSRSD